MPPWWSRPLPPPCPSRTRRAGWPTWWPASGSREKPRQLSSRRRLCARLLPPARLRFRSGGRGESFLGLLDEAGGAGGVVGRAAADDHADSRGRGPEPLELDFDAAAGFPCLEQFVAAARLDGGDRHAQLRDGADDGGLHL